MAFVEMAGLSKRFSAHGRSAFENVSLSVERGAFVALIGPSGDSHVLLPFVPPR